MLQQLVLSLVHGQELMQDSAVAEDLMAYETVKEMLELLHPRQHEFRVIARKFIFVRLVWYWWQKVLQVLIDQLVE